MYEEICIDSDTCTAKVGDKVRIVKSSSLYFSSMIGEIVEVAKISSPFNPDVTFYAFYYKGTRFNWHDWRFERV